MKTATIKTSLDIHIQCPHCDNWENTDEWTPRRKLQAFKVVDWADDIDEVEQSITQCLDCKNVFKLSWNYEQT